MKKSATKKYQWFLIIFGLLLMVFGSFGLASAMPPPPASHIWLFTPATSATVAPTVRTDLQTNLTQTTVILNGEVLTAGSPGSLTERGFWFGTGDVCAGATSFPSGNGLGKFSVDKTNLSPNTIYSFNTYAKNSNATNNYVLGTCRSFTTPAASLPITISISPLNPYLIVGGTQQFNATVSNYIIDSTVTWSATSGHGSFDANTGSYTAISVGSDTVTATSDEDPTKNASTTVTVGLTPIVPASRAIRVIVGWDEKGVPKSLELKTFIK